MGVSDRLGNAISRCQHPCTNGDNFVQVLTFTVGSSEARDADAHSLHTVAPVGATSARAQVY